MFIKASMTRKVISINPEASVPKARILMSAHKIRHLPVVDKDDRLIGIITDRDIRSATPFTPESNRNVERPMEVISRLTVEDVMTRNPHTISDGYTFQDVLARFQESKVGAFPVVDAELKVIGIISERDLLQSFIQIMGISQPGAFIGVSAENRPDAVQTVVDAIAEEGVAISSLLTLNDREKSQSSIIVYLLTQNTGRLKTKLTDLGFSLTDPMEGFMGQFRWERETVTV